VDHYASNEESYLLAAVVKFGYMLEQLSICRYRVAEPQGDNPYSAANQQESLSIHERKCWFLAGLIEGEGSLCISIKKDEPRKLRDFQLFRDIVMAMEQKSHFDPQGLVKIVESAYQMNMAGKQRSRPIGEITERILRDYTPNPLLLEW